MHGDDVTENALKIALSIALSAVGSWIARIGEILWRKGLNFDWLWLLASLALLAFVISLPFRESSEWRAAEAGCTLELSGVTKAPELAWERTPQNRGSFYAPVTGPAMTHVPAGTPLTVCAAVRRVYDDGAVVRSWLFVRVENGGAYWIEAAKQMAIRRPQYAA